MENILKDLKEIEENFMASTQAMAPFPTPVVDATGIKVETKPNKDKDKNGTKEVELN